MIKKFKIFENNKYYESLIRKIQSALTPDLLKGMWKKDFSNPMTGHCYIATEALYWILGGPNGKYNPYVLSHKTWPEGLDGGETHWFLKNDKGDILDPTKDQFEGEEIRYDKGTPNGMMNYPSGGSKRAKEIMRRIDMLKESINEMDPYGEEDWSDEPKFPIGSKINIDIENNDRVYGIVMDFDPVTREYEVEYYLKHNDRDMGWGIRDEYRCYPYVNESISHEIDPYGEEDWNDSSNIRDFKPGDKVYCYKGRYEDLDPNKEYEIEGIHEDGHFITLTEDPTKAYFFGAFHKKKMDKAIVIKTNEQFNQEKTSTNKIKAAIEFIRQTIKGTEWEGKVYMAGGAVRDELLGKDPKDIDLLVNAEDGGIRFAEWITKELGIYRKYKNPVVYPRFGTAKFTLRKQKYNGIDISDVDIECVMPRKEVYSKGDRKPDVYQGTLKDDVDRRDFSVNSLLKDLTSGEILDLTGMGKDDIKRGIIRTPLDPDIIFTEDALRMLRAVRFSVKYNWDLPMFMIKSMKKNAKQIQNISSERVQEELNKMIVTDFPDKAIRLLQITGLSKYIFPELDKLKNLTQNKFHKYDAMRHTLEVLKNTPPDLITRLAALFHDIGKSKTKEIIDNEVHFYEHERIGGFMVRDIMKRLRYPSEIINAVVAAVENHMRTKQTGDKGEISDRALRKLRLDLGDHLQSTLDLIHADNISHSEEANMPNQVSNIRRRFKELEEKDKDFPKKSPLNGDDVMEILGIKKGPVVGKILKILGDMYLDDPSMSKEELTEIVKKLYEELK